MPFLGLGLHLLIAIWFAVHAVRTGQPYYWLFILFSFPLLGSIVYALTVYLPQSRLHRGTRQAVAVASRVLDPGRELREAQNAYERTPTASNRMRLASALLDEGQAKEAAANFEACLQGLFANDPAARFGAARARFAAGDFQACLDHLESLRDKSPDFQPEAAALLQARTLGALGRAADAGSAFQAVVQRFASFEAKAEYLIWSAQTGDLATARTLHAELEQTMRHWPGHTRDLHQAVLRRVEAAIAGLR